MSQKNFSEAIVAHIDAVRLDSEPRHVKMGPGGRREREANVTLDGIREAMELNEHLRGERDEDMPPFPPMVRRPGEARRIGDRTGL